MVSDQEPRYRLVDSDGNIVGSLYGKADGSIAIQETASGADREVALAPDGTFSAPSVETESVSTEELNNIIFAQPNDDIKEIVESAPSNSLVKLPPGTVNASGRINDISTGVHIKGAGMESTTLLADASGVTDHKTNRVVWSDMTVEPEQQPGTFTTVFNIDDCDHSGAYNLRVNSIRDSEEESDQVVRIRDADFCFLTNVHVFETGDGNMRNALELDGCDKGYVSNLILEGSLNDASEADFLVDTDSITVFDP